MKDCLSRNSHFLIYTGQDGKGETPAIQWEIVQWLKQAVNPINQNDFSLLSLSSSTSSVAFDNNHIYVERSLSESYSDNEISKNRFNISNSSFIGGLGGKRRKLIVDPTTTTNSVRMKLKETNSKILSKNVMKGKNSMSSSNLSKKGAIGPIHETVQEPGSASSLIETQTKPRNINLGAFSAFRRISVWNTVRNEIGRAHV